MKVVYNIWCKIYYLAEIKLLKNLAVIYGLTTYKWDSNRHYIRFFTIQYLLVNNSNESTM